MADTKRPKSRKVTTPSQPEDTMTTVVSSLAAIFFGDDNPDSPKDIKSVLTKSDKGVFGPNFFKTVVKELQEDKSADAKRDKTIILPAIFTAAEIIRSELIQLIGTDQTKFGLYHILLGNSQENSLRISEVNDSIKKLSEKIGDFSNRFSDKNINLFINSFVKRLNNILPKDNKQNDIIEGQNGTIQALADSIKGLSGEDKNSKIAVLAEAQNTMAQNLAQAKYVVTIEGGGNLNPESIQSLLTLVENSDKITLGDNIRNYFEELNNIFEDLDKNIDEKKNKRVLDSIKNIGELFETLDSEIPNNDQLSERIEGIQNLINSNRSSLKTLFENINGIGEFAGKNTDNIANLSKSAVNIVEIFQKLNESEKTFDEGKVKGFISGIIDLVGTKDEDEKTISITNIFHRIDQLGDEKQVKKIQTSISSIQTLFNSITSLGDIDSKKLSNIRLVIHSIRTNVLDGIVDISKKIENISTDIEKQKEPIRVISSFFDAITSLADIGFKKRFNMLFNVQFIKWFIADDIASITKTLSETSKDISKQNGSFEALSKFFNAIVLMADIDKKKRKRMKSNIRYVKNYIVESVKDIIESLSTAKKLTSDQSSTFAVISTFFEMITKFAEIGMKKRLKMRTNVWFIKSFIINSIEEIIKSLDEVTKSIEKGEDKLSFVKGFIDEILAIGDIKLMKLLAIEIKMTWLDEIIQNNLSELIKHILGLKTDKLQNKMSDLIAFLSNFEMLDETIISFKTILSDIGKLTFLGKEVIAIGNLLDQLKELEESGELEITKTTIRSLINNQLKQVEKLNEKLSELKIDKSINNIASITIMISNFVDSIKSLEDIPSGYESNKSIENYFDDLRKIAKEFVDNTGEQTLGAYLKDLVKVDPKKLENIIKTTEELARVSSIINKVHNPKKGIKALNKLAEQLKDIIENKFGDIDEKAIKQADRVLKGIMMVVVGSAAVLLLSAFVMTYINPVNVFAFAITLGAFMMMLMTSIKIGTKGLQQAYGDIEDFGKLVVICGITMLVGSLLVELVSFGSLIEFTVALSAFMFGIIFAFNKGSKGMKSALDASEDFTKLVLVSGLILIIGGLVMQNQMVALGALEFAAILTAFIFGVVSAYKFASKKMKDLKESIYDFFKIVVISGAMLLIGGMIIQNQMVALGALEFAAILSGFIFGVVYAYKLASKKMKDLKESIYDFFKIVVISGAMLVIAGLIMSNQMVALGALEFAVLLAGFVFAVVSAYKFASKLKDMSKSVYGFFALTIVSGLILLAAGMIMQDQKRVLGALKFAAILAAFVFGITWIYGKVNDKLGKSYKGAIGLAVLVLASGLVLALGAFIGQDIKLVLGAIAFGAILMAFVYGITWIYGKAQRKLGESYKGAIGLAVLVLASGLVLALGAFIGSNLKLAAGAAAFGLLLGGFIFMLTHIAFGKKNRKALFGSMSGVVGLMIVVAGSALVLLIGGALLTAYPQLAIGVAAFGALLAGFIFLLTRAAYSTKNRRAIVQSIPTAIALMIVVGASAAALLIGGWYFMKYPDLWKSVAIFGTVLVAFVGVIGLVAGLMGNYATQIAFGLAVMAGIVALVFLSSFVFDKIATIVQSHPTFGKDSFLYLGVLSAFVGGMALIAGIIGIPALAVCIGIGLAVMAGIIGITYLSTMAFENISIAMSKNPSILKDIGTFGTALTNIVEVVGGLAAALTFVSPFIAIGTALLLGISGIILISSVAMLNIVKAADSYNAKKFDQFKKGLQSFGDMAKTLADTFSFKMLIKLPLISEAVSTLAKMIGKIAEAVQEYSELKISIYKGTEVVGYRTLKPKDFKEAAKNVKTIISTLGNAVIDIYNKRPDIFETNFWGNSAFAHVTKSLKTLAPMISKIAEAVKEYADMKIKVYEGTKVVGYRHLGQADFENAANNVKIIIETLGGAVVDAYGEHPDYYDTNFWGNSPFAHVTKSLKTLGPMISSIAWSVKDYADLKVAEEWEKDKNGNLKPSKYRHLNEKDFQSAADNVKIILDTLGGAIVDAYTLHPDYYDTNIWGNSPFAKTVKANMKLAKLISSIARSVKDYADLKIVEEWEKDKDGNLKPSAYRHLNEKDFQGAADNVTLIISTLGGSIINAYEAHPEYYESGSRSKFAKTIEANLKLAKLISSIARSVKDYADLKIVEKWEKDKDGNLKPAEYRHLKTKDFQAAADNVSLIISTLGGAIIQAYEAHPDYYEGGDGGWFSSGSKFNQTINANIKLAKLIGSIANSVKDYVNLKVVTEYDEKGQPKNYRQLDKSDFKAAADNINTVISTLGDAIMKAYDSHQEWFDDGEDSKFAETSKAISTMGEMIGNIAQGIQNYASLKMPDYSEGFDENGNPKKYIALDDSVFKAASDNIGDLIGTLGQSLVDFAAKHPEYFDDGDDSTFMIVTNATATMGEMISNIATALQGFADLKIPTKYNDEGAPIEYREMGKQDVDNAATNIKTIISTVGGAILDFYNTSDVAKQMFKTDEDNPDSVFSRVVDGCAAMGDMIASIAEGIQTYATLEVPVYTNGQITGYRTLSENDFTSAATNIEKIITTIGSALIDTYNKNPSMFNNPPLKTKGGFLGLFDVQEADTSDTPFMKVVQGCAMMGGMIASIAEGVRQFASMMVPEYEENGTKIIGYRKLDKPDYKNAADNIKDIITTIGDALITVYDENKSGMFNNPPLKKKGFLGLIELEEADTSDTPFMKVVRGCAMMGGMIASIAQGVRQFASMMVPEYEENGTKIIGYRKLDKPDYKNAADNIKDIITTIARALGDAYKENKRLFNNPDLDTILKVFNSMGNIIWTISNAIQRYAFLVIPNYKEGTTKIESFTKMTDDDFVEAGKNIKKVITTIGESIADVAKDPAFNNTEALKNISTVFATMGNSVATIGKTVQEFASMRIPIGFNADGTVKDYRKMNPVDFTIAALTIRTVITTIANAIKETIQGNEELFGKSNNFLDWVSNKDKPMPVMVAVDMISKIATPIKTLADVITKLAGNNMVESEYDSNGKLKSQKTSKFDPVTLTLAALNISSILLLLGNTIKNVYNQNKEMFDVKDGQNPINLISDGINKTMAIINTVYEGLNDIASNQNLTNIDKLNTIEKSLQNRLLLMAKLNLLLTTSYKDNLISAGIEDWQPDQTFYWYMTTWGSNGDTVKDIVNNSIKGIVTLVESLFGSVDELMQEYAKYENLESFIKSSDDIESIVTKSLDLFSIVYNKVKINQNTFKDAVSLLSGIGMYKDFGKAITGIVIMTFAEASLIGSFYRMAKNSISAKDFATIINLIETSITGFEDIYHVFDENKKVFAADLKLLSKASSFISDESKLICNLINNMNMISLNMEMIKYERFVDETYIYDLFLVVSHIEKFFRSIYIHFDNHHDLFDSKSSIEFLLNIRRFAQFETETVSDLVNKLNMIISNVDSIDQDRIDGSEKSILTMCKGFVSCVAALGELASLQQSSNSGQDEGIFGKIKSLVGVGDDNLSDTINYFVDDIQRLVDLSQVAREDTEGYENISNGINSIQSAVNNIKSQKIFKQHTEQLGKYVKTVNKIDIKKISKLTDFANSLNKLANKMGNLDNLTKALAENVTSVLDKLVNELQIAKKTIDQAEKIQNKRHKAIEDSRKKIEEMMKKSITVEISAKEVDDESSDGTTSGFTPTSSGGGSLTSSGDDSNGGSTPDNTSSTPSQSRNSNNNQNMKGKAKITTHDKPAQGSGNAKLANTVNIGNYKDIADALLIALHANPLKVTQE